MIHSNEPGRGLMLSRYSYTLEPEDVFMDSNQPDPLFSIALSISDNVNTHKEYYVGEQQLGLNPSKR